MQENHPQFIIGYKGLAPLFGTSAKCLVVQKIRGRFTLEPVQLAGKTYLFDRQQALDYVPVYRAQYRKRNKG